MLAKNIRSTVISISMMVMAMTMVSIAYAGNGISFENCGHNQWSTWENRDGSNFTISGCNSNNGKCILRRGKDLKIVSTFVSNQDTATLKLKVFAKVGRLLNIATELDACVLGIGCPVQKGKRYNLNYNVPIPWAILLGPLDIQLMLQLVGDEGVLACVKLGGVVEI